MTTRRQCMTALGATLIGLGATTGGAARAQASFPSRPITLMVPWPAGAPSDSMARKLQPHLQKSLGQTVVVDNLGGAGGTLGVTKAMQQPADGHTILVGTPTELVLSPMTIPAARYKPEDFSLIGNFGRVPYVLCCRAGLAQTTVADVIAQAAKGGTPLTVGNIGAGSMMHLMALDFEKTTGLKVTHVPYRGLPPMLQDALSGQLDLVFLPLAGSMVATIEQGRIRPLGVTTPRPSRLFPQFPTLASGHVSFERFDYDVWGGLLVRSETPLAVQERLHQWWTEVTADSEFLAWSRSTGSDPQPVMSLAEARSFYSRDVARYTALLKAFPEAARG
jgi:tripartite-type tricarboxylate transporter receptor subunit TctC